MSAAKPLSIPNFLGLRFDPRRYPKLTGSATLTGTWERNNFGFSLRRARFVFQNFLRGNFFDAEHRKLRQRLGADSLQVALQDRLPVQPEIAGTPLSQHG